MSSMTMRRAVSRIVTTSATLTQTSPITLQISAKSPTAAIISAKATTRTMSQHRHLSGSSSSAWMKRHIMDEFVKKARYQNYRARSAFKLIQLDDQYRILQPGQIVIECGSAPGSWTQVIVERLKLKPPNPYKTGACISLDLLDFTPVPGAICLPRTDFTSPVSQAKLLSALDGRKADVILSDMAPNVTGQHNYDHERILRILVSLIQFSMVSLQPGGHLLFKIFNGSETLKLVKSLEKLFDKVIQTKPPCSRLDSSEMYILAHGFKGSSIDKGQK